jgi:hypothetical protein
MPNFPIMQSPFKNDMFAMVYQAFHNLWPEKECEIFWEPNIREDEDGRKPYGLTDFAPDGTVWVFDTPDMNVRDAVEILAHELAHVAVGVDVDHGKEWEDAFEAIFQEYNRIAHDVSDGGEDDGDA